MGNQIYLFWNALDGKKLGNVQVDMYTKVVVKAFKAKCLKNLTAARLAIEMETNDLIKQLERTSINRPRASNAGGNGVQCVDEMMVGGGLLHHHQRIHLKLVNKKELTSCLFKFLC